MFLNLNRSGAHPFSVNLLLSAAAKTNFDLGAAEGIFAVFLWFLIFSAAGGLLIYLGAAGGQNIVYAALRSTVLFQNDS